MAKRLSGKIAAGCFALVTLAGIWTLVAHAKGTGDSWKGYVTDTWCGVNRDTKAPSVECTNLCVKTKGAKFAFYNLADKKVYILNPQSLAGEYAGQLVTVTGTVGTEVQKFDTMRGVSEGQTMMASSISKSRRYW